MTTHLYQLASKLSTGSGSEKWNGKNRRLHPSSWGQHATQLGPVGPTSAPCFPYEPCYWGYYYPDVTNNTPNNNRRWWGQMRGKGKCVFDLDIPNLKHKCAK